MSHITCQKNLMKNTLVLYGIAFAFFLTSCSNTPQVATTTLSVIGTGSASTDPDVVDINFGVDTVDQDFAEAVSQNTNKMNEILFVFENLGISEKDIQTTNYSSWVEDVYDQSGQLTDEKRYRVSNMVSVRLRELDQISTLIEEATSAGVTNVSGINFGVADSNELELEALENALDNAREKATWMASKTGASLGEMVNLIEGGYYSPPIPVTSEFMGLGGGGTVPISQGQFSMTTQVQVVYELIP